MTTPDLPGRVRSGLIFYGAILNAALEGQSTSEIWATIKAQAQALGLPSAGVSAADVSRIRGMAGAEVRAMNGLVGAQGTDSPLTYAVSPPWAGTIQERNASPTYLVRYAVDGLTDPAGNQAWRTVKYGADNIPGSMDALLADLEAQNEAMDADYGTESGGIAITYAGNVPGLSIHSV